MARFARSSPCWFASARSSGFPRLVRCSSSASSPRRQACSTPRESPRASRLIASARQPVARTRAEERRLNRAARSSSPGADSRPAARATRPASSQASTARSDPLPSSLSPTASASVTRRRPLRPLRCRANSTDSSAWSDHQSRRCLRNRVRDRSALPRASSGSSRASSALAWASRSSASSTGCNVPVATRAVTSRTASSARPAANRASHRSSTRFGGSRSRVAYCAAAASYRPSARGRSPLQ